MRKPGGGAPSPKVQVFLLCYNRPLYLAEVIPSILAQTGVDFELVISDNSTDDRVFHAISEKWPELEIRRRHGLNGIEHINLIFSEASSDHVVLFHDDDRMREGFLFELSKLLDKNSSWSAVASNALVLRQDLPTEQPFNADISSIEVFTSAVAFGRKYLMPRRGLNPFPGYMYRTSALRGLTIDFHDAKKYSDMVFLMKLIEKSPIAWSPQPLMFYRLHGQNDSGQLDLQGSMKIRRQLIKRGMPAKDFELEHFRHWRYALALKKKISLTPWRKRAIKKACISFFARHPKEFLAMGWRKVSEIRAANFS